MCVYVYPRVNFYSHHTCAKGKLTGKITFRATTNFMNTYHNHKTCLTRVQRPHFYFTTDSYTCKIILQHVSGASDLP